VACMQDALLPNTFKKGYKNMAMANNLKAMRTHRALALLYGALGILFFFIISSSSEGRSTEGMKSIDIAVPLIMMVPGVVHALIAFGAAKSAGWARICSILVAVLMLFGFPIGTLIGVYLLANSTWPETQA
jgi:hypothetical protein